MKRFMLILAVLVGAVGFGVVGAPGTARADGVSYCNFQEWTGAYCDNLCHAMGGEHRNGGRCVISISGQGGVDIYYR